jgi:hypothetical protein
MMPGENIKIDGSSSNSKSKKQVYTNISPLLIGVYYNLNNCLLSTTLLVGDAQLYHQ